MNISVINENLTANNFEFTYTVKESYKFINILLYKHTSKFNIESTKTFIIHSYQYCDISLYTFKVYL